MANYQAQQLPLFGGPNMNQNPFISAQSDRNSISSQSQQPLHQNYQNQNLNQINEEDEEGLQQQMDQSHNSAQNQPGYFQNEQRQAGFDSQSFVREDGNQSVLGHYLQEERNENDAFGNQGQANLEVVWTHEIKTKESARYEFRSSNIGGANSSTASASGSSDIEGLNQDLGYISKESPNKLLVFSNNILKVVDVNETLRSDTYFQIDFSRKELVYSSFKSNYLVTNYIDGNHSILELRKMFHSSQSAQSSQEVEYLSSELSESVSVNKVHLIQGTNQQDSEQMNDEYGAQNNSQNDHLIVLRRNSCIIEIREVDQISKSLNLIKIVEFQHVNQRNEALKIEDFQVLGDRILLNFENQKLYVFYVNDLYNQGDVFSQGICKFFRCVDLRNDNGNQFRVSNADIVTYNSQFSKSIMPENYLVITKEAKELEMASEVEVFNLYTLEGICTRSLTPVFSRDIESTQEFKEILNINGNSRNFASAEEIMLRNQRRKILDTFSTPQGLFILAKEGRCFIVYRLYQEGQEIMIEQINKGQLLKSSKIVEEVQSGRFLPSSLRDTTYGYVFDIILLSQNGNLVSQLRVSNDDERAKSMLSSLTVPQLLDPSLQATLRLDQLTYDQELQMAYSNRIDMKIVVLMLRYGLYKKIAEYIGFKYIPSSMIQNGDQTRINTIGAQFRSGISLRGGQTDYVFQELGSLTTLMKQLVLNQLHNEVPYILSRVKFFQNNYKPDVLFLRREKEVLEISINDQLKDLMGYESIFMAIVQREKENVASNLSKYQGDLDTQESERNIRNIEAYIRDNLLRQKAFMMFLRFFVASDYLAKAKNLQRERNLDLKALNNDLQRDALWLKEAFKLTSPIMINYYPLTEIEQYTAIFNASTSVDLPLSLLGYHIKEFAALQLDTAFDLSSSFQFYLGELLEENQFDEVQAFWELDHLSLSQYSSNKNEIAAFIVGVLLKNNSQAKFDHFVLMRLATDVFTKGQALNFINLGGCSRSAGEVEHLKSTEVLSYITQLYLDLCQPIQAFEFLKKNESTILSLSSGGENIYENMISQVLENIIQNNQFLNSLCFAPLSDKQQDMIQNLLVENHMDLLLPFQTYRRRAVQGLAFGLTQQIKSSSDLPHEYESQLANSQPSQTHPLFQPNYLSQYKLQGNSQLFSQARIAQSITSEVAQGRLNPLKQLLHVNYLAALGEERQQATYKTTGMPLNQVQAALSEQRAQYNTESYFNSSKAAFNKFTSSKEDSNQSAPLPTFLEIKEINQMNQNLNDAHSSQLNILKSTFLADPFFKQKQTSSAFTQNQPVTRDFFAPTQLQQDKNQARITVPLRKGGLELIKISQLNRGSLGDDTKSRVVQFPNQIEEQRFEMSQQNNLHSSAERQNENESAQRTFVGQQPDLNQSNHSRTSPNQPMNLFQNVISPDRQAKNQGFLRKSPDQHLILPTDQDANYQQVLGTQDDLLYHDTDHLAEMGRGLPPLDDEEDDVAIVNSNAGDQLRMTAAFGQGSQPFYAGNAPTTFDTTGMAYQEPNRQSNPRNPLYGRNLSTIQESLGESNYSAQPDISMEMGSNLGGAGDFGSARQMRASSMVQGRNSAQPRSSLDNIYNVSAASVGGQAIPYTTNNSGNPMSGGGFIDGGSALQRSELITDENLYDDVDYVDNQLIANQEVYDLDDEGEDMMRPGESPEQFKERRERNILMRNQARDVKTQRGYETVSQIDILTRSQAKKNNIGTGDLLSLTPPHRK